MKRNLRAFMVSGLMMGMAIPGGDACVNTNFSQRHEKQITGDAVKIIMGQFARHGRGFWEVQLNWNKSRSDNDPNNPEFRNDMAVALLKLQRYDEAKAEFEKIETTTPGLYKTYSNLGVLLKKTGNFREAAAYTKKALEVKPEGHLGLGDYYLKMLHWRAAVAENKSREPLRNFLGILYKEGPEGVNNSKIVNGQFLKTLIIADHNFPDVYVVYGDLLAAKGETELACRCYKMAQLLNDGTTPADVITERLKNYSNSKSDRFLHQRNGAIEWVKEFQKTEAALASNDHEVDFDTTRAVLKSKNISEPVYPAILPEKKGFLSKLFGN